jgi:hypothetical protein
MKLFNRKPNPAVTEWNERQLLPIGVTEFHEWADRIIDSAGLPAEREDQKYVLASMVLHDLKPTDHAMNDGFFISKLRKVATNQVVHQIMNEIKAAKELRAEQAEPSAFPVAEAASETKP